MKLHEFDVISFVSGLVATLIGLMFLLPGDTSDLISAISDVGRWLWPALLLGLGLAVVGPLLWRGARDQEASAGDGVTREDRQSL